ncbi:MAG: Nif3-like dinuclear metal center hexameric protein [Victivallaceae bacterium]|nr:Nif3-like dinuclear metal center hexameric protein [Victivallaceae bacterium]
MKRQELTEYLDQLLRLQDFSEDISNNGLQIEGGTEVLRFASAVDGCIATVEQSVAAGADFLFVHHGISWGSEPRRFTGRTAKLLQTAFQGNLNLYAAHLPLDANVPFGNNAQLADRLKLENRRGFFEYDHAQIGFSGELPAALPARGVAEQFHLPFALYGDPQRLVRKVGIVSGGGGQDAVRAAADAGLDLLVTGAFEHEMYHLTLESKLTVAALGHYASETLGVQAILAHVRERFQLETIWLDLPTGL